MFLFQFQFEQRLSPSEISLDFHFRSSPITILTLTSYYFTPLASSLSTTMALPPKIDDYIKQSIDHYLGLPISSETLDSKLRISKESEQLLLDQNLKLLQKLKEKNELIENARNEATVSAQTMKKFVEENQKLAAECEKLVAQCTKMEKECALYEHDRTALMEFENEANQRATEAYMKVQELEDQVIMYEMELKKLQEQKENESVDSSASTLQEEDLLESLLATVNTIKDESFTFEFLDANTENEHCKKLLSMWSCLKQSTKRVLSLVTEVMSLEKDKEHLRINLDRAEQEGKLLFDENSILEKENKILVKKCKKRNHPGSGEKLTNSTSAKSNKRKSSSKTSSPMSKKIDIDVVDSASARQPLSPLGNNSTDCRVY